MKQGKGELGDYINTILKKDISSVVVLLKRMQKDYEIHYIEKEEKNGIILKDQKNHEILREGKLRFLILSTIEMVESENFEDLIDHCIKNS